MRFLSNFGWKIIFMHSVNIWHQQDSNSLFKGSIGHVTCQCKRPIVPEGNMPGKTARKHNRRQKEPRGRVFSRKVTELKVLQVSKNGLMKKRLHSFSISVFIQKMRGPINGQQEKIPSSGMPAQSVNKACKSSCTGLSTMIDYNCMLSLYS